MVDERSSSLASRTAKAELQQRIQTLQKELRDATRALEGLPQQQSEKNVPSTPLSPSAVPLVLNTKKGYLFKWMDRSIGWSGTKWALRFVELIASGRLSYYGTHSDTSPKYVLSLKGCAVRDDGWKQRNPRIQPPPPLEEPGAYFFIFSIYQRKSVQQVGLSFEDEDQLEDDDAVVPLLRFSTPSLAEKNQWVQLISEACAYCETEEYLSHEATRAAEILFQQEQQARMALAMPEAKDGTLPPLYFAPAVKAPAKRPSFNSKRRPSAKLFRSKSANFGNAEKQDAQSTKSYPPSKPMHRAAVPSYLSIEAKTQNYRGFLNLGVIILVVSNFRLILGTVRKHGFVVTKLLIHMKTFQFLNLRQRDPWQEFPFVCGFLLQFIFMCLGFAIEWLLSRRKLEESVGMSLHHLNAHTALAIPLLIVWHWIDQPPVGAVLLLHATITWMKLISYMHANEDYRLSKREKDSDRSKATMMALVENLDAGDADVQYPQNVSFRNVMYYWFAPTLTYQIAFPKYPHIRVGNIAAILVRMVVALTLFTFIAAQVVGPALESLVADLEETNGTFTAGILAEYWLRLSIANTYLWLLMFYLYFHLYLNLFAELLRFGDRVFYKDWWNSSEVSAYWRLWNTPVHYWLIRHIYFPCLRLKMSRAIATFVVFFISAIMHEVLVSVPFHMIRPWSFIGMMMQMPLVAITKFLNRRYPGSSIGNLIFWMSFCVVGQPMAILLYTVDYQYGKHHAAMQSDVVADVCRVRWGDRCLIR